MKLSILENDQIDLTMGERGLQTDDTLQSAVIVSLLTDRRANPEDVLPDGKARASLLPLDRRGWCGDALAEIDNDLIGSRLWLLQRAKQTEETRLLAIDYASEALAWLIEDGLVISLDINAAWANNDGRLEMTITLYLADGSSQAFIINIGETYGL